MNLLVAARSFRNELYLCAFSSDEDWFGRERSNRATSKPHGSPLRSATVTCGQMTSARNRHINWKWAKSLLGWSCQFSQKARTASNSSKFLIVLIAIASSWYFELWCCYSSTGDILCKLQGIRPTLHSSIWVAGSRTTGIY